jgi:hypothetical protein
METVADRRARTSRRSAPKKRGYFTYVVPRNSHGKFSDIGGDLRVFATKKLKGLNVSERELVVSALEKFIRDRTVIVTVPKEGANTNKVLDQSAFEPDARARTILRGVDISKEDLAAGGGSYKLAEVQRILNGISRQRVERRVQEGSLLAVPGPSNRRVYPTVQFNRDGSIIEGLADVQRALKYSSPWSVLNFLLNESDGLDGRRPIDLLREGEVERVVEVARATGSLGN